MEERHTVQVDERLRSAYEAGREAARHFGQEEPRRPVPQPGTQTLPGWHH